MELTAVINGLNQIKEPCDVTVISDSKYVTDAINKGWVYSWEANGWRKSDKKPAQNVEKQKVQLFRIHGMLQPVQRQAR